MKKLLTVLCMIGLNMLCSCGEGEVKEPKLESEGAETIITENIEVEEIIIKPIDVKPIVIK